jgi:hypothetical protein
METAMSDPIQTIKINMDELAAKYCDLPSALQNLYAGLEQQRHSAALLRDLAGSGGGEVQLDRESFRRAMAAQAGLAESMVFFVDRIASIARGEDQVPPGSH